MAGLSATAQNALRGPGYGNNINPNLASIYGLGYASAGYDVKKLDEQIALAERELDEQIKQWNTGTLLNLMQSGYGSESQREGLVQDITGYELDAPKTQEEQIESIAKRLSMSTPARDIYTGYGSFRPESQQERESRYTAYMYGLSPMSGHNVLSHGPPAMQPPTANPRNPTVNPVSGQAVKNPLLANQTQTTQPSTTTGLIRKRKG